MALDVRAGLAGSRLNRRRRRSFEERDKRLRNLAAQPSRNTGVSAPPSASRWLATSPCLRVRARSSRPKHVLVLFSYDGVQRCGIFSAAGFAQRSTPPDGVEFYSEALDNAGSRDSEGRRDARAHARKYGTVGIDLVWSSARRASRFLIRYPRSCFRRQRRLLSHEASLPTRRCRRT